MSRVVSVDKSLIAGGTTKWFVTTEDTSGNKTRVEIDATAAERFKQILEAQTEQTGPRVLTETIP